MTEYLKGQIVSVKGYDLDQIITRLSSETKILYDNEVGTVGKSDYNEYEEGIIQNIIQTEDILEIKGEVEIISK